MHRRALRVVALGCDAVRDALEKASGALLQGVEPTPLSLGICKISGNRRNLCAGARSGSACPMLCDNEQVLDGGGAAGSCLSFVSAGQCIQHRTCSYGLDLR